MTKNEVIPDLRDTNFKIKANFSKPKDTSKKISVSSTSHHFTHLINEKNILISPNQNSLFEQTMNTYQNIVLKAGYSHDMREHDENSTNLNEIKGEIGYGSNGSVFSKIRLNNLFQ